MTDLYDYEWLLRRARENIPKSISNPDRFQIPEIDVVVEGKSTVFRNFMEFVKKIDRDPQHFYKYLLKELGVAGTIQGDRVVFKGKITPTEIKERIDNYVKIYVTCYECNCPDTYIKKEGRVDILVCKACGAMRPVHGKVTTKSKIQLKEGETYEVEIIDISKDGYGIAKIDEYTIYVPNVKKGARVKVKVEKIKKNIAFGTLSK